MGPTTLPIFLSFSHYFTLLYTLFLVFASDTNAYIHRDGGSIILSIYFAFYFMIARYIITGLSVGSTKEYSSIRASSVRLVIIVG